MRPVRATSHPTSFSILSHTVVMVATQRLAELRDPRHLMWSTGICAFGGQVLVTGKRRLSHWIEGEAERAPGGVCAAGIVGKVRE